VYIHQCGVFTRYIDSNIYQCWRRLTDVGVNFKAGNISYFAERWLEIFTFAVFFINGVTVFVLKPLFFIYLDTWIFSKVIFWDILYIQTVLNYLGFVYASIYLRSSLSSEGVCNFSVV